MSKKGKNVPSSSREQLAGAGTSLVVAQAASSVLPFLLKTAVYAGVAYYFYNKFADRFEPMPEVPQYGAANITLAQAEVRANAIEKTIPWFGEPDMLEIARQMSGLNYNGFVRLYNAWGKRRGTLLGGNLNLIEWFGQQLSAENFQYLGALQNHVFF